MPRSILLFILKWHEAMTLKYIICLISILTYTLLVWTRSAHAQERFVYWIGAIHPQETRGNTIFRYALDSAEIDTLVQASVLTPDPSTPRYFYDITVDTINQHIYWTDSGGMDSTGAFVIGAITRASWDGSSPEGYLGGIVCGVGAPTDIELDMERGDLYWGVGSDCGATALNRGDLLRLVPNEWESLPTRSFYVVGALALDVRRQMIYWTNNDFFVQEPLGILRAPFNETTSDEYVALGSICDIALAHTLSKIYWTHCTSNVIRRANLDGTEGEDVIVSQAEIGQLAIDHKARKIYWTESVAGKIRRANLDGTDVENLITGLVVPSSIALSFGWDVSVGVEQEEEIPNRANLHSSYPNPFQESTTIAFDLTETDWVTLEIYDQLGRRIEVLASQAYSPGTFRIQWNPKEQANGVYFCRMTFQNKSKTIPLVIQR
jgi:hypothetical protein